MRSRCATSRNCLKADPAYGKGVADALGIRLGDAEKNVA